MSDTNLPPNIENGLNNATSRLNDFNNELGQQVRLARNFNKQVGGLLDNLKKANEVFGNVVEPLNSLTKAINALNKTMIASAKISLVQAGPPTPAKLKALADLQNIINNIVIPPDPGNPGGPGGGGGGSNDPNGFQSFLEKFQSIIDDNTQAIKNSVTNTIKFFNIGDNVVKAFKNFEALNEKSLAMGVSYQRFISENSEALENSRVGQQQLLEVMVSNFGAGIRMNSKELQSLNEEMIATGQDTRALESVNVNLLALTGKNNSVVSNLARINQEVSDEYQISNTRLIQAMSNLSETMEQASFFGSDAVEAVGSLGMELQGLVGVDMPREINTAISLLIPSIENIGIRQLAGLEGVQDKLLDNTITLSDLAPALERVLKVRDEARRMDEDTANTVAANQFQVSEQQFRQLSRLAEAVINGNAHQSDIAKKREEEFNQVRVLREKQLDYFTRWGPDTYKVVETITPAINSLALGLNLVAGVGSLGQFGGLIGGRAGAGIARAAGAAGVGLLAPKLGEMAGFETDNMGANVGAALGAGIGSLFAPVVGTAIGSVVGTYIGDAIYDSLYPPLDDIRNATERTAEEQAAAREAEQQRLREEQIAKREEMTALVSLASYLRTQAPERPTDPETFEKLMRELTAAIKVNNRVTADSGNRNSAIPADR